MRSHSAMNNFRRHILCNALVIAIGIGGAVSNVQAQEAADRKSFDVPAQPAASALNAFAEQADITLVFSQDDIAGIFARAVDGSYTTTDGLKILLEGTHLSYQRLDDGTIVVEPAKDVLSQTPVAELATIEVIGSRIRGTDSVSPISIYSSEDIERSGYATVQQFLQTLSQNFSGGQSDQAGNISGAVTFTRMGSGVNLRGLGNEATLVLLNGQRLAPAGTGNFVDVGMIPASAIDRIEVLTDGASAIYGSDAVGGVVNFILREDFEGGDTRIRYGTVTEGSSSEYRVSQTLGRAWTGGSFLGSYEFYKREPLDTESRAATRIYPDPSDIFPGEQRHSLLLHLEQKLGERLQLIADGQYGDREGNARDVDLLGQLNDYDLLQTQYGGRLGLVMDLRSDWRGEVFASYSSNENDVAVRVAGIAPAGVPATSSDVAALDVKADGRLFQWPGGTVKAAIGGQLRTEQLDYRYRGVSQSRDASSVFGEVSAPIVGADNAVPGLRRLTATAAVRYDRYDDFGDATNTKLGLLWSPMDGIGVRATYGTSFRAPSLFDVSPVADQVVAILVADQGGAPAVALLQIGSNPELQPETAHTWTAGVDFQPRGVPGFKAALTYYQIDYDHRITALAKDPRAFQALQYESIFSEVITRNPSPAEVVALTMHPRFANFGPIPTDLLPTMTDAVIDLRSRNLAGTRTRGLDLSLGHQFGQGRDLFGVSLDGTYVLEHSQRITGPAPWEDRVGTTLNPSRFKLRSGFTWSRSGVSAALFVNHTDGYTHNLVAPAEAVDAWTTIDLNLRYAFGGGGDFLRGLAISASVVNLFNEAPPYLAAVLPLTVNYDPSNADALGRFVALQISKEW